MTAVDSRRGRAYPTRIASRPSTEPALPAVVERALREFLDAARATLGDDLRSAVLYGSAAEGALRPTSDVNLILVLRAFDPAKMEALREPYRIGRAAIGLAVMYLLDHEVAAATQAFAVKFTDVAHRRRVLYGPDPFATLAVPRAARIARLRQVLLNQTLRLREHYVRGGEHEEQLAAAVAAAAGPLRAAAATLLEIEGSPDASPKQALARVGRELAGDGAADFLAHVSALRERRPDGRAAGPTLLALIDLAQRMYARAARLDGDGHESV